MVFSYGETGEMPMSIVAAFMVPHPPMIVPEDMIEKWDGKMPQIMAGGGGMMMDISKVIGGAAAKK